ncbi:MAG TPA: hypothetical protein VFB79_09355 [Candidatus Angelobacter sp.]|nr:hypothetical protein [Candidatus Angelobacter sp.]
MLKKGKVYITSLVLGMFLVGIVPAQALDRHCDDRIRKAEFNLREAVRKHGEHSRQAEKRRHELEDARAHCR